MKKHAKIVFKEFGSSFGRFIAIAGIIMLGLSFMIGLNAATPDIKASFTEYFAESELYDFSVRSETGLTKSDADAVLALSDVDDVMSLFSYDAYCTRGDGDKRKTVRFYGVDFDAMNMNKLTRTDGKMPDTDARNEAVAVIPFGDMESVSKDMKLTVSGGTATSMIFAQNEFDIVGTVSSPMYFSTNNETCTIGDGNVDYILFVSEDVFRPVAMGMFTEMWVSAKDTDDYTAFTAELSEYHDGVGEKIEEINKDWYVLGRDTNLSYYSMSINADKVVAIAGIFPLFFIAVAALVAFSTIVRMVDEDRAQIGTLRSLGYRGARIVGKYIFYSIAACVLGLIGGIPLGLTILPLVIWNAYGSMYALPAFVFTANWLLISLVIVAALGATALVTVLACRSSIKETPAQIMQPRAPKPGKRILLERIRPLWAILPFKYKATFRNIFRFKRNLIMTVLAVAGCSALILAGFGMLNSTAAVTDLQFNEIYSYDLTLGVSPNYTENAELTEFLENKNHIEISKERGMLLFDDNSENTNIVSADERLNDYIDLGNAFDKNSVLISKGAADSLGITVGDTVTARSADGMLGRFEITGVVTLYSECWLFVGQNVYADVYGAYELNSLLIDSGIAEADQSETAEKLYELDCVTGVTFTSAERKLFDNLSETISLIVVVLIACAGALVIIVLYNLTNINIGERKKEIATLKVLGYRRREVAGYVFREIFILVVLGIFFGIGLGWALLAFILNSIQAPYLLFPTVIYWWSYLISAGLTIVFSGLVDLILLPKLNKIDMAESMKAVD